VKFIVKEKDREYEFLLAPGIYVVGRDATCDVTLGSTHVSRRHMSCRVSGSGVEVSDLGSRNGTYVGGLRVKSATLKDADTVRVGDVEIVFQGTMAGAVPELTQTPPAAPARAEAVEPSVEDQEQTPADGALLPQKTGGGGPQLLEREGRWFVRDAGTGREVEIVPAEQGRAEAGAGSILSTPKGRLMIGGLAVVAIVILVAALLGRSGMPADGAMSSEQYDRLIGQSLAALDGGDTGRAEQLAREARAAMPKKTAAKVVLDLAGVWDAWRADFFDHWVRVDDALQELSRCYRHESNPTVERFVRTHRDGIQQEVDRSQAANRARERYESGAYEEAWQELSGIPEDSPVRSRDAELYALVSDALHSHLSGLLESAAARQDWAAARGAASKLRDYYPEESDQMAQTAARYADLQSHAARIQDARDALDRGDYEAARRSLAGIPQDSPYRDEAARLLHRTEADEKYAAALARYNAGDAQGALGMLADQTTQPAQALQRHVQAVMGLQAAAADAQAQKEFVEAERLWLDLLQLETDARNAYRRQASAQLDRMPQRRLARAGELAAEAERQFKDDEIEKARELYEKAAAMDPDGQVGLEALQLMREAGRMEYRRALNMMDQNPQEALRLFTRACRLLTADDKYYTLASDKKRDMERE